MIIAFALGARTGGRRYINVEFGVSLQSQVGMFHFGADARYSCFGVFQFSLQLYFARDCLLERGCAAARIVERLQSALGFGESRFDVAEFFDALRDFVALPPLRFAVYGHLGKFGAKDLDLAENSFRLARLA